MNSDGATDLWNNGPAAGDSKERFWDEMGWVAPGVCSPEKPGIGIYIAGSDGNGKDNYKYVNPSTRQVDVWYHACIT